MHEGLSNLPDVSWTFELPQILNPNNANKKTRPICLGFEWIIFLGGEETIELNSKINWLFQRPVKCKLYDFDKILKNIPKKNVVSFLVF